MNSHPGRLVGSIPALAAAWAMLCMAGCRTTIVPPQNPPQPTQVYLIDYGRTSAVALPVAGPEGQSEGHGEGQGEGAEPLRLVRYVYGEWDWYALRCKGTWQAVRALAWPTPSAFGRAELAAPVSGGAEALRASLGVQQVYELTVSGDRVAALRRELDALHARLGAAGQRAHAHEADFVEHPRDYWLWCNSNHQSAMWLEELGCETRGWAVLSRWRVQAPRQEGNARAP